MNCGLQQFCAIVIIRKTDTALCTLKRKEGIQYGIIQPQELQ